MTPAIPDDRAFAESLNPLIRLEVASIGAIGAATEQQEDPAYVALYHETKTGKQANVEQMATLLRMRGERPVESGGIAETIARMQTMLAQKVDTTMTLKAMRLVEERLVAGYRTVVAMVEEGTLRHRAISKVMERGVKNWHVLTAHIAKRTGDAEEASRLPYALSAYFTGDDVMACMRCLFDRPGSQPAIEKRDPHPYTYICSACHDEVLSHFPPDLLAQASRWPDTLRHDRVAERALGKPEKLRALHEAVAVLSDLEPEIPVVAPRAGKIRHGRSAATVLPPDAVEPPVLEIPREGAGDAELAYTDLLFDFTSVRRSW